MPKRLRTCYRTKDGLDDYFFSFEEQENGEWRANIEDQPSYGNMPDDCYSTHRLWDGNRKHICWTKPLFSLEEAKQVAALWADNTQAYIRNGENSDSSNANQ